jgi:hypothetical protein
MASQPFTAAFHNTLVNDIPGNTSVSSVMPGYPDNLSLSLSGGGKRKNKRRSNKRSKRSKRSRSSRRNPEEKVVRGARLQTRPSASHYYNKLNKPVGYKISYRPRKGGKYIMHKLALRKNGNPFWKALEKLPKKSRKGRKTERSRTTRRNSRGQKVRTRRPRYLNRRGNGGSGAEQMDDMNLMDVPSVVALENFSPITPGEIKLQKGNYYKLLDGQDSSSWVLVKDTVNNAVGYVPPNYVKFDESDGNHIVKVTAKGNWSASGRIIPENTHFKYANAIDINKGLTYITFPKIRLLGPTEDQSFYYYGGPQGGTLDKFGYFPEWLVDISF